MARISDIHVAWASHGWIVTVRHNGVNRRYQSGPRACYCDVYGGGWGCRHEPKRRISTASVERARRAEKALLAGLGAEA